MENGISRISVIGLGKLGSPLTAFFTSKGFSVIGVDYDKEKVDKINARVAPVNEPGLGPMLRERVAGIRYTGTIEATQDIAWAVNHTQATFIIVPTPSNADGSYSLKYVLEACTEIGKVIKDKKDYHLVVVTSTVMPGDTEGEILTTLALNSEKKINEHFGLCYNPEFIALGSVLRDLQYPDLVLIGESDKNAGDNLQYIYERVFRGSRPPFKRMSIQNAELTKIAINTFITTKISYANMVAELCEKFGGGDVDVVTDAIGEDSRIGKKFLKGGAPFCGPCLPRDCRALACYSGKADVRTSLMAATDTANRQHARSILKKILSKYYQGDVVGIIGLAYKNNSEVLDESLGKFLEKELSFRAIKIETYDSNVTGTCKQIRECIQKSNIVVLTLPLDKDIDDQVLLTDWYDKVVIDVWREMKSLRNNQRVRYVGIGLGE